MAIYRHMRDGELRVLRSTAVDTKHQIIKVTEAADRLGGAAQTTKSNRVRSLRIEPALRPLLEVLLAGGAERLLPWMPTHMSRTLRRWLKVAKVDRHELHHASPTTRPIRFHDLRATGITWTGSRRRPAAHHAARRTRDFETTQAYLRLADALKVGFGEVFQALVA